MPASPNSNIFKFFVPCASDQMQTLIPSRTLCSWLMMGGAAACCLLMAFRLASVVSLVEPVQTFTSGDEQSSLLAVWRVAHGESPYQDRFVSPYALVSYNWLYYQVYGVFTALVERITGLPDAWLPTIGRLFTALGAAWSGFVAYVSFGKETAPRIRAALALLVAFGPLIGFWALTVRPDVWALALEITALGLFLILFRSRPRVAVALAAVLFYAAWSFKQTAVIGVGTIILFLVVRGQWRYAVAVALSMVAAWSITFALAGKIYAAAVLFGDVPLSYSFERSARNLGNFLVKELPVLLPVLALALPTQRRHFPWRHAVADDAFLIGALGIGIGLPLTLFAASQTGASENYYFSSGFFLALVTARVFALIQDGSEAATISAQAAAFGFILTAALVVGVIGGHLGVIDVRGPHRHHLEAKACLDPLPRPLFVESRYLSLPWITPGAEPFVLSFFYEQERSAGKTFEGGGIGGRIGRGEFSVLALATAASGEFDGGSLERYIPIGACAGYALYLLR